MMSYFTSAATLYAVYTLIGCSNSHVESSRSTPSPLEAPGRGTGAGERDATSRGEPRRHPLGAPLIREPTRHMATAPEIIGLRDAVPSGGSVEEKIGLFESRFQTLHMIGDVSVDTLGGQCPPKSIQLAGRAITGVGNLDESLVLNGVSGLVFLGTHNKIIKMLNATPHPFGRECFAREKAFLMTISNEYIPQYFPVRTGRGLSEACMDRLIVTEFVGEHQFANMGQVPSDILAVGARALDILKSLHATGFVHGDIHGGNFVYSGFEPATSLRLIDFGRTVPYIESTTGMHIADQDTPVYEDLVEDWLSVFELGRSRKSRRDDMYRLAEMLIKQGGYDKLFHRVRLTRSDDMLERKKTRQFQRNVPKLLIDFYAYCTALGFDQEPDYTGWADQFRTEALSGTVRMSSNHRDPSIYFYADEDCMDRSFELTNGDVFEADSEWWDRLSDVQGLSRDARYSLDFRAKPWVLEGKAAYEVLGDMDVFRTRVGRAGWDDRCWSHAMIVRAQGVALTISDLARTDLMRAYTRILGILEAVHARGFVYGTDIQTFWDSENVDSIKLEFPAGAVRYRSVTGMHLSTRGCGEFFQICRSRKADLVKLCDLDTSSGVISRFCRNVEAMSWTQNPDYSLI